MERILQEQPTRSGKLKGERLKLVQTSEWELAHTCNECSRGSSTRSVIKTENGKLRLSERNASLLAGCTASGSRFNHASVVKAERGNVKTENKKRRISAFLLYFLRQHTLRLKIFNHPLSPFTFHFSPFRSPKQVLSFLRTPISPFPR